jgi:hypothetical protein
VIQIVKQIPRRGAPIFSDRDTNLSLRLPDLPVASNSMFMLFGFQIISLDSKIHEMFYRV